MDAALLTSCIQSVPRNILPTTLTWGAQACHECLEGSDLDLSLAPLCKILPDVVLGCKGSQGTIGSLAGQPQALCHRYSRDSLLTCTATEPEASALSLAVKAILGPRVLLNSEHARYTEGLKLLQTYMIRHHHHHDLGRVKEAVP